MIFGFSILNQIVREETGNFSRFPADPLLSCNDLVEFMRHKLPRKIAIEADLAASIADRHRRRQLAKDFAYTKQAPILSASGCNGV